MDTLSEDVNGGISALAAGIHDFISEQDRKKGIEFVKFKTSVDDQV
jgi:hypothetical protein